MNDQPAQSHLLEISFRRLLLGVALAIVFFVFWYLGNGCRIWGAILSFAASPLKLWMDIGLEDTNLVYSAKIGGGVTVYANFPVNQLNLGIAEVVTLMGFWPHKNWRCALKLAGWCLVWLIACHLFEMWVHTQQTVLGPDLANRQRIWWEPSVFYSIIETIASFDKFILRWWVGFPVFGLALVTRHFLTQAPDTKKTAALKKKSRKG